MNAVLQSLLQLQSIEFSSAKASEAEIAKLREVVPPPILGHYDRLVARGKKGVALIRNQTCTGCYMRQPIGKINILMRGEDIQLCDSCGRYLYLAPEEPAAAQPAATPAAKPAPKPRGRKPKAAAVATA